MNRRPEMIPPLFFIPLPPSNLRPFGAPPSIGRRECPREPLPLEGAAERSEAGLASFFGGEAASSLPFTLGKGDRAAVDRVLSLIVDLRCISSLSFIPLSPSNLRPFGAPPSIGRREYPREPLPLEGAAERSEAGLASFFGGEAASSLPSPLGKGDRAAVDRVLSQTAYLRRFLFHLYHLLETIFPALFHTARTLSGSLRSPPSPRREGGPRSGE